MDHLGDLVWSSSADPSATKKHLAPSNPASPPTNSPQISINKPSPTPARSNMTSHLLPNMSKQQQQPQQQQPTPSYVVNSNIRKPMSPLAAQQPSISSPAKPADPFGNLLNFGSSSGKSSPSGTAAGRTLEEQRLAKEAELRKNRSDDMLKGFGNLAAMDINSNSAGISRSGSPSANVLSATQQVQFSSSSSSSSTPASPNTQYFPQSYKPANTPPPPTSSSAPLAPTKPVTAGKPQTNDAFSGLINPTPMRAKLEMEKEKLDRLDGASLNQLRTKSPSPLMPSQSNVSPERTSPKEKGGASSPWDLDYLAAPKPIYANSTLKQAEKKQVGDDSFDLGIFEKALVDMTPETDASLTTRPISITKDPSSKQPTSTSTTAATTSTDHMVARMVDMGYDVSAAQAALAASGNQSVLAAIELITQQREQLQSSAQRPQKLTSTSKPDQQQNEPRSDLSHPSSPSTSPTMTRQKFSYKDDNGNYRDPSASSSSPPPFRRQPAQRTNDTDQSDANMFNRDKLLAQANFLKKSVLVKASTLVKQGQTKVKAAVSEVQHQLREFDEGAGRSRADGRPRWMSEATSQQDEGTEDAVTLEIGSFRDDEEDERGRRSQQKQQISPNQPHGAVGATSPTTRTKSQPQPQPQPVPTRAVLPKRPVVACAPSVIQEMETHKTKGNECYKLGQFGAADESYSVAISLLPAKHQLLIALHSNRALARLKTGDHPGARDDATLALELIGEDYLRGADEIGPGGEGVVFADMYTKARIRRAQAFEGMEKYEEALKDYREVMAFSPGEKTVSTSMGRCQKAIRLERTGETARSTKDGGETSVGTGGGGREAISPQDELLAMFEDSPSARRPQSHVPEARSAPLRPELDPFALGGGNVETSSSSGGATKGYGYTTKQDIESSARVASMRAADAQTEQEDNERILLKDSVDAQINLWKGRKENNIRALLASLDTVLWPEMEWKPVGMHELVTPGNVKIKYMKAIGKVHPDKLSCVSAEQRLIAQDVFNALNEAYNAFKSQNNP